MKLINQYTAMKSILMAMLLISITGCSKVNLYSQLTEHQANEIVAILLSAKINADKENFDKTWAVVTSKSDLPRAVKVLHDLGYPRDSFLSLGEVFKKEGFVSSPTEERARFLFGLQQELEQTLSQIDGVIKARVHLSIPERDPLSDKIRQSSAAVLIKVRSDQTLENHTESIKAILVNSVDSLAADNVTVKFFPAQSWPMGISTNDSTDKLLGRDMWMNFTLLITMLTLLLALIVGWRYWRNGFSLPKIFSKNSPINSNKSSANGQHNRT